MNLEVLRGADFVPEGACEDSYLVATPATEELSTLRAAVAEAGPCWGMNILLPGFYHPAIGGPKDSGFVCERWRKWLETSDVAGDEDIFVVPPTDTQVGRINGLPGTRTEMEMLWDFLMEKKVTTVLLVDIPYHLLRAYLTAMAVRLERREQNPAADIKIFCLAGAPLDWMEPATHSQGNTEPRCAWPLLEISKIMDCVYDGFLPDPAKVLDQFLADRKK